MMKMMMVMMMMMRMMMLFFVVFSRPVLIRPGAPGRGGGHFYVRNALRAEAISYACCRGVRRMMNQVDGKVRFQILSARDGVEMPTWSMIFTWKSGLTLRNIV